MTRSINRNTIHCLYHLAHWSTKEIAQELGCSHPNVSYHLAKIGKPFGGQRGLGHTKPRYNKRDKRGLFIKKEV